MLNGVSSMPPLFPFTPNAEKKNHFLRVLDSPLHLNTHQIQHPLQPRTYRSSSLQQILGWWKHLHALKLNALGSNRVQVTKYAFYCNNKQQEYPAWLSEFWSLSLLEKLTTLFYGFRISLAEVLPQKMWILHEALFWNPDQKSETFWFRLLFEALSEDFYQTLNKPLQTLYWHLLSSFQFSAKHL